MANEKNKNLKKLKPKEFLAQWRRAAEKSKRIKKNLFLFLIFSLRLRVSARENVMPYDFRRKQKCMKMKSAQS